MVNTAQAGVSTGSAAPQIGGNVHTYQWHYQGQPFPIVYETRGEGDPVLLLPAFSTVSTRGEMQGIAEQLAPHFQVIALDWLGFGDSARPAIDYKSALYQQLLHDFVHAVCDRPLAVVAAGHAAGYVMQATSDRSVPWSHIILVAPTWRGPFPTMMGTQKAWFGSLRQLVGTPILGQALYKLNTLPSFLRFMYRRHVYADPAMLTPALLAQKYQLTQQSGARFAPAAFVTGGLDPVAKREEFVKLVQAKSVPIMVVIGDQSPPQSKAEMDALTTLPGVQSKRLPGSLGLHEEYAAQVAELALQVLL